jgi:hypothetical protein
VKTAASATTSAPAGEVQDGAQLVDERHALRLRGHERVGADAAQATGERPGGGADDLGVAEEVEECDADAGCDLDQRQVADEAVDLHPVRQFQTLTSR